jgi:hypothetical protein
MPLGGFWLESGRRLARVVSSALYIGLAGTAYMKIS